MIAALASRIRNQAKHTLDLVAKEAKIKLEIEKSTESTEDEGGVQRSNR